MLHLNNIKFQSPSLKSSSKLKKLKTISNNAVAKKPSCDALYLEMESGLKTVQQYELMIQELNIYDLLAQYKPMKQLVKSQYEVYAEILVKIVLSNFSSDEITFQNSDEAAAYFEQLKTNAQLIKFRFIWVAEHLKRKIVDEQISNYFAGGHVSDIFNLKVESGNSTSTRESLRDTALKNFKAFLRRSEFLAAFQLALPAADQIATMLASKIFVPCIPKDSIEAGVAESGVVGGDAGDGSDHSVENILIATDVTESNINALDTAKKSDMEKILSLINSPSVPDVARLKVPYSFCTLKPTSDRGAIYLYVFSCFEVLDRHLIGLLDKVMKIKDLDDREMVLIPTLSLFEKCLMFKLGYFTESVSKVFCMKLK